MIAVIDAQMSKIDALCRLHNVQRLEIFGSAADGNFDPNSSDLDFLVEFFHLNPSEHYEAYFGLWEGLKVMFQRKVDLVESKAMQNPYFIRRVNESRKLVYAA